MYPAPRARARQRTTPPILTKLPAWRVVLDAANNFAERRPIDFPAYATMQSLSLIAAYTLSPVTGLIGTAATVITAWIMAPRKAKNAKRRNARQQVAYVCRRTAQNFTCFAAITASALGIVAACQEASLQGQEPVQYAAKLIKSGIELHNGASTKDPLNLKGASLENLRIETRNELPWYERFFTSFGRVTHDVPMDYTNLVTGKKHTSYRDTINFNYRDVGINGQSSKDHITSLNFLQPKPDKTHTTTLDWSTPPKPDPVKMCVGAHDPSC